MIAKRIKYEEFKKELLRNGYNSSLYQVPVRFPLRFGNLVKRLVEIKNIGELISLDIDEIKKRLHNHPEKLPGGKLNYRDTLFKEIVPIYYFAKGVLL